MEINQQEENVMPPSTDHQPRPVSLPPQFLLASSSLSLSLKEPIGFEMRKGAKRKASEKEEAIKSTEEEDTTTAKKDSSKSTEEKTTKTESSKAGGRRKKIKPSKPESEPEFFPDKRNLEDLWKQVFPVGTEWDQLDQVYQYKWNFSNLENAFEEGGELYGQKVYLFGSTEPQLVFFKDEGKVTCIPVVVAVVSPFPPSNKIGINSVQREAEEIVPMKQMKMDWVPYIPLKDRDSQVERLKSQIFILSCTQRRVGLRHLKLEHVKKFEYCLPYFYQPLQEDEFEQSTIVQIMFPAEPKPTICEFDWELDELEEFTDKLIEEEELSADQKDAFKDFVRKKVGEGKKANREAREARKKALAEMSEETKTAFQNMKFYKFYPVPTPDSPDVSNVKATMPESALMEVGTDV
ncbi:hypothetical protein RHGRI_022260 [Rhododendron griersonianum]|uniref:Protein HEAT INTOLERANT 4-like n=1 Tax=Rhododendron griersonianum TaxID=479676 RepID=A0AAV6IZZ6_9ERIC|nr:hypothetical protein RHGRI_022260 [Rhododendron griersonianum]KAG5534056.1 hypothetical protein RHGRI_022260 [Rhododendron griersonianum]